jgi:outer membrane protein assembly factor BamB
VGSPEKGTLVAFDKQTGRQLWTVGQDNTAYASLMVGTLAGVRQVVHFTADALMGVDVASGRLLWRLPVKTGAKRHVFTPLIVGDTITIASSSVGLWRYRVSQAGGAFKVEPVWSNPEMKIVISTSVLVGDKLFGVGATRGKQSDFACVDFNTGKTLWTRPGFDDYASVLALGNRVFALNSTGEMFLLGANAAKYEELGRTQVCGKTWSFPAYANGVLYVRDDKAIRALAMGEAPLP